VAPPDTDSILLYTKLLAITSGIVSAPKIDFFVCHHFLRFHTLSRHVLSAVKRLGTGDLGGKSLAVHWKSKGGPILSRPRCIFNIYEIICL